MPSPSRDSLRCTMNVPTAGAVSPISIAMTSAIRMKSYCNISIMRCPPFGSRHTSGASPLRSCRLFRGNLERGLADDTAVLQFDGAGDERLHRAELVGHEDHGVT